LEPHTAELKALFEKSAAHDQPSDRNHLWTDGHPPETLRLPHISEKALPKIPAVRADVRQSAGPPSKACAQFCLCPAGIRRCDALRDGSVPLWCGVSPVCCCPPPAGGNATAFWALTTLAITVTNDTYINQKVFCEFLDKIAAAYARNWTSHQAGSGQCPLPEMPVGYQQGRRTGHRTLLSVALLAQPEPDQKGCGASLKKVLRAPTMTNFRCLRTTSTLVLPDLIPGSRTKCKL